MYNQYYTFSIVPLTSYTKCQQLFYKEDFGMGRQHFPWMINASSNVEKNTQKHALQGQPLPAPEPPYQYRTYARITGG